MIWQIFCGSVAKPLGGNEAFIQTVAGLSVCHRAHWYSCGGRDPHLHPTTTQLTALWAPPLARFFQFFDQLRRLRMWKMQLLDEHHLFIKYTSEDVVTLRVTDPSQVCVRACARALARSLSLVALSSLSCTSFVF